MALNTPIANRPESTDSGSPIENEIPSYRAISALAVTSALLGVVSALCFVDLNWLPAAALGLIFGVMAERKIRRRPDALTGRSFAQAGIALSVIFASSSFAYSQWQSYHLHRSVTRFARTFTQTLNETKSAKPLDTTRVMFYLMPPAERAALAPEDVSNAVQQMFKDSMSLKEVDQAIRSLFLRAGQDKAIRFEEIENAAYQDMAAMASVLLTIDNGPSHAEGHGPEDGHAHERLKAGEEGLDHALVVLRGVTDGATPGWFVEQISYPYTPKSYKPVVKKATDEHGHSH